MGGWAGQLAGGCEGKARPVPWADPARQPAPPRTVGKRPARHHNPYGVPRFYAPTEGFADELDMDPYANDSIY